VPCLYSATLRLSIQRMSPTCLFLLWEKLSGTPLRPCFERSWNEDCSSYLQHPVFTPCKSSRSSDSDRSKKKSWNHRHCTSLHLYIAALFQGHSCTIDQVRFHFLSSLYLRVKVKGGGAVGFLLILPRLNSCTIDQRSFHLFFGLYMRVEVQDDGNMVFLPILPRGSEFL
jgi:hypothetical protein